MKTLKIPIVILLVLSLMFVGSIPCAASPFIMYQLLVELAAAVGGPEILISILISSGAITGATGALILTKLGVIVVTITAATPWYANPWAVAGVAATSAVVGAGAYYYLKDITKEDIRKSLQSAYNSGKITSDSFMRCIGILDKE